MDEKLVFFHIHANTHFVTVTPSHSVFRVAGGRPAGNAREVGPPATVAMWTAAR